MRIAIFTGSASGPVQHGYAVAEFAAELAAQGVGIVYGGGRVGLMGVVADSALAVGGEVIGVMPKYLVDREIAHLGLSRLEVVADMHHRKARMAELADGFVALPGGAGTLEELFEAWTWGQLGLHSKPVGLFDVAGFYAPLTGQLQAMTVAGYLSQAHLASLGVVSTAEQFLQFMTDYEHPPVKWAPASSEGQARTSAGRDDGPLLDQPFPLTVVGWVFVRDARLLAVRSRGRDRFYLPGGKIEPGETLLQALAREVKEELGTDLVNPRRAFTVQAPAHGLPEGTVLTMHCFHADATVEPQVSGEIVELAWLAKTDAHLAAPAVQDVLRLLNGGPSGAGRIGTR